MCGITGFMGQNEVSSSLKVNLEKSLSLLKQRGPDDQRTKLIDGCGLGHSRLSIIDLSEEGAQPLTDPSGRYSIVFNGEIFNYLELKAELNLSRGINSDTMVLLCAFKEWGAACLSKLHGFFSFAIYDSDQKELFLARDRFGMKPLHYTCFGNTLFFASELKSLLEYPVDFSLSKKGLNSFLNLSYLPMEQSILEGVQKLLPGQFLRFKEGNLKRDYFYKIPKSLDETGYEEAKVKLRESFSETMKMWVRSDVDVAAFLSGGIDSSIVVGCAAELVPKLSTYSIGFPDSPYHDESRFARQVAERFDTEHFEINVTNDELYASIEGVLDYMDEPFADTSAIPSFALCRAVSAKHKVALSGDGADEVFGGYEKYRGLVVSEKYSSFKYLAQLAHPILQSLPQGKDSFSLDLIRKAGKLVGGIRLDPEERYWSWTKASEPKTLLKRDFLYTTWNETIFEEKLSSFKDMNDVFYRDVKLILPSDMLTKVDLMSMANSLEVRPPLLDHTIVDWAFSLPASYKILEKSKKRILVDAFKDMLPKEVYSRPKHGFTIELMPFFKGAFWEKINDLYLNEKHIREQGIFEPKAIESLKKRIKVAGTGDLQPLVWSLITFQNFMLKYKSNMLNRF